MPSPVSITHTITMGASSGACSSLETCTLSSPPLDIASLELTTTFTRASSSSPGSTFTGLVSSSTATFHLAVEPSVLRTSASAAGSQVWNLTISGRKACFFENESNWRVRRTPACTERPMAASVLSSADSGRLILWTCRLEVITASMLLKSCATLPVTTARVSSRCASSIRRSAAARARICSWSSSETIASARVFRSATHVT